MNKGDDLESLLDDLSKIEENIGIVEQRLTQGSAERINLENRVHELQLKLDKDNVNLSHVLKSKTALEDRKKVVSYKTQKIQLKSPLKSEKIIKEALFWLDMAHNLPQNSKNFLKLASSKMRSKI